MKVKKLLKKFCIILAVLAVISTSLFIGYKVFFDPYRGTVQTFLSSIALSENIGKSEAVEDLSFIIDKLEERHPACMDGIPTQVMDQYNKEVADLPEQVTILELWQSGARILAKLKDAHTNVGYHDDNPVCLPLTFDLENNTLFCTTEGYKDYTVKLINGIAWEDLYQTYLTRFSYELENYAAFNFCSKLPYKYFLEFVGDEPSSKVAITFINNNEEITETFTFDSPAPDTTQEEAPFVTYQIDKARSLGILTLLSCDYNDYYCDTVKEFFTEVKNNDIKYVAVDLRNNGGGNSMVANEFIRYLDVKEYYVAGGVKARYGSYLASYPKSITTNKKKNNLLFTGKVYALTSDETFSSAKMFANIILDNRIGEIVGEIPGNMPASYGDILSFQTPNAKLSFHVSYKYFGRIDESKADLPLIPDYEVKAEEAIDKLYEIIGNVQ